MVGKLHPPGSSTPHLEPKWPSRKPSCAQLRPSWVYLEVSWHSHGGSWGHIGANLGQLRGTLRATYAIPGPTWTPFALAWADYVQLWVNLVPSEGDIGTQLRCPGSFGHQIHPNSIKNQSNSMKIPSNLYEHSSLCSELMDSTWIEVLVMDQRSHLSLHRQQDHSTRR